MTLDPIALIGYLGYAVVGMFLLAAVKLARASLR